MLKFQAKLLRVSSLPPGPMRDRAAKANEEAKAVASMLRHDLSRCTCDDHPEDDCIACIVAKLNGEVELVKADFCCPRFAQQLTLVSAHKH